MIKKILLVFLFTVYSIGFLNGFENLEDAMPEVGNAEAVIKHGTYILEYSELHEQAKWVVYKITPSDFDSTVKRKNKFKKDTAVVTQSATSADYKGSGYDRGHLKPANVSKTSVEDMAESFYYSNMSPQVPGFNRGIWKTAETFVAKEAESAGTLWVVTGPVLEDGLEKIGENEVSVPRYYYKVIVDIEEPNIRGIALLMENKKSDKALVNCAMSIDKLESLVGIDFFPNLDDALENEIESNGNFMAWDFPILEREEDVELPGNINIEGSVGLPDL